MNATPLRRVAGPIGLLVFLALGQLHGASAEPESRLEMSKVEPWRWRRVDVAAISTGGEAEFTAIAVDPVDGRVAVGHAGGVSLGEATGATGVAEATRRFRAAARLEGVTDLAFDDSGALWIATLGGLWRRTREGALSHVSPGTGDEARRVRRLSVLGSTVAVGTDGGAFVAVADRPWQAVDAAFPSGPVAALVLTPSGESGAEAGAHLWLASRGDLWRLDLSGGASAEAGSPVPVPVRLGRIPGLAAGTTPLDLSAAADGSEIRILAPSAVIVCRCGGAAEPPSLGDPASWQVTRPVLPPGASARRLQDVVASAWLATDRGLLRAPSVRGLWQRGASPVGGRPVRGLALAWRPGRVAPEPPAVWLAADHAVYLGIPVAALAPAESPAAGRPDGGGQSLLGDEPPIADVHAAALEYSGLLPEYFRGLRGGLGRRAWLPHLNVGGGYGWGRSRRRDRDQTFVSGDTRHLLDRESDQERDWDVAVALSWHLPDLVYDPEAVDLSREARQVVALRDDILDEINQLYFERHRLLALIDQASDRDAPEIGQARIRAAELAAGLDGWTGGWFGERLRAAARRSESIEGRSPRVGPVPQSTTPIEEEHP